MPVLLDKVFEALSHEVRRRIIEVLGVRGELPYSELLRATGVESSTLSFHLKRLQGIVIRTDQGYSLTALGKRAWSILSFSLSRKEAPELLIQGEKIELWIDDALLESAFKRGKKLAVRNVAIVGIDRGTSISLMRRVLVEIRDVLVAYVPKNLFSELQPLLFGVMAIIPYTKLNWKLGYPLTAIEDLKKRGYVRVAEEIEKRLKKG